MTVPSLRGASRICGVLLLCLVALGTFAKDAAPASDDPVIEARMLRIAGELRCLVCQNQTIADSHAGLAEDLREEVRILLRKGESDEQVVKYMTDRYGDFVLYRPPVKPTTLLLWFGPGAAAGSPVAGGESSGTAQGDGAHALNAEQVAAMIAQLAERLKSRPDDAEGWQMLARSNVVIGKHAQAIEAFKEAARLRPDDANLLADYADALAMTNNRSLDGEPGQLIERALKLEPNNPKALALAGTAAFDRRDYKAAVRHWEKLVRVEPADGPFAQQVQGSIAEARQLAGMPPAATLVADAAAPTALAQVSGTVSLAPALKGRVAPDDTLFVFARAVDGPRMPLGIVRKRVSDLPLQFTIDDSMAMSPDAKLSSASRVIVGARISKGGNAMPQNGDYQGLSPAVAVGSAGLKLVIDQEVSK